MEAWNSFEKWVLSRLSEWVLSRLLVGVLSRFSVRVWNRLFEEVLSKLLVRVWSKLMEEVLSISTREEMEKKPNNSALEVLVLNMMELLQNRREQVWNF